MEQEKTNFPKSYNTPSSNSSSQEKKENFFKEIVKFALLAAVIVLPIRIFIAQPFIVKGPSMDPTFASGQYLIVDQISYRFEEPKRGDVIILKYPYATKKTFFIKRIIGLPSETVELKNKKIFITDKNGIKHTLTDEPYINSEGNKDDNDPFLVYRKIQLKNDEYFVMGDNRTQSSDSTVWGALKRSYIVGKPFLRLFPLGKVGIIPGSGTPIMSEVLSDNKIII